MKHVYMEFLKSGDGRGPSITAKEFTIEDVFGERGIDSCMRAADFKILPEPAATATKDPGSA